MFGFIAKLSKKKKTLKKKWSCTYIAEMKEIDTSFLSTFSIFKQYKPFYCCKEH